VWSKYFQMTYFLCKILFFPQYKNIIIEKISISGQITKNNNHKKRKYGPYEQWRLKFSQLFKINKYLLSIYYIPDPVIGDENSEINKSFKELPSVHG
jgi:hypothetical protein